MVIISGRFFIRSDKRAAAVEAMLAMAAETHKEEGCLVYDFSADLVDETKFYIYEEWETAVALDAHGQTAHMATFRAQLSEMVSAAPQIKRYTVD